MISKVTNRYVLYKTGIHTYLSIVYITIKRTHIYSWGAALMSNFIFDAASDTPPRTNPPAPLLFAYSIERCLFVTQLPCGNHSHGNNVLRFLWEPFFFNTEKWRHPRPKLPRPKSDVPTLGDITHQPRFSSTSQITLFRKLANKKTAGTFYVSLFLAADPLACNHPCATHPTTPSARSCWVRFLPNSVIFVRYFVTYFVWPIFECMSVCIRSFSVKSL